MTWIIPLLLKAGLGQSSAERLAKPLGWAAIAIAAIALLLIGKCAYDRHVVSDYQNGQAAHDAPIVRQADENSSAARAKDQQQITEDQRNEQNAITDQPSNGLTPMERARACAVLVRQARDLGEPRPAGC